MFIYTLLLLLRHWDWNFLLKYSSFLNWNWLYLVLDEYSRNLPGPWMFVFVILLRNLKAFFVFFVKIPEGLPRYCQMNILIIYALISVAIFTSRGTRDIYRMKENWYYSISIYLSKTNFRFINILCYNWGYKFII